MKKKIIIVSLILIIGLGIGATIYLRSGKNKGQAALESTDIKTTTLPVPDNGTPYDYDPLDSLFIAAGIIENANSFSTETTGSVKASVMGINYEQKVSNTRIKNGDESYSRAISTSSLVSVAVEKYHKGNSVVLRNGKFKGNDVTWPDSSTITKDKCQSLYGWEPKEFCGYILARESITNGSKDSSLIDGKYYKFTYTLYIQIAAVNYQRQVKTMASAKEYPRFDYITLDVLMDAKWNVHQIISHESYYIEMMGMSLNCNAELTETFKINDNKEIPNLDFFREHIDEEVDDSYEALTDASSYLAGAFGTLMDGKSHYFTANINAYDFNDQAQMILNIKDLSNINLMLKGTDFYVEYSYNTLYLRLNDLKIMLPIDNSSGGTNTSSLSLNDLSSMSFLADALNEATISKSSSYVYITLPIRINNIKLDVSFKILESDDELEVLGIYANINDGLARIDIDKCNQFMYEETKADYINISDASFLYDSIKNFIETKKAQISIDTIIKYKNISIEATGIINAKENKCEGTLDLKINNVIIKDCYFAFDGKYLYVSVMNINVKMTVDELLALANTDLANTSIISKDNISINEILNNLPDIIINNDELSIIFSELTIRLYENSGINLIIDNYTYKDITVEKLLINVSDFNDEIVIKDFEYSSLADVTSFIDSIKELINNETLYLEYDTTVYNNKLSSVKGYLYIDRTDQLKINATATVYDTSNEVLHNVELTYIDEMIYISYIDQYGNPLKVKIAYQSLKESLAYILSILNIEIPYIDQILGNVELDTGVFNTIVSDLTNNDEIIINEYIKSMLFNSSGLNVVLNGSKLFDNLDDLSLSIVKENNKITSLSATNIKDADLYVDVKNNTVDLSGFDPSGYDDMSYLNQFIKEFVNTANLKKYHLSGDASLILNLAGLNIDTISPKIDVYISLDENYLPTVHAHIVTPVGGLTSLALVGNSGTNIESNLYYNNDGYLYLTRTYTSGGFFGIGGSKKNETKILNQNDLSDVNKIMEIVYFLFGLNNTVQGLIPSMDGETSSSTPRTIATVYESCLYTNINNSTYNSSYAISLNGAALTQNDNINDIKATVYTDKDDTLKRLSASLGLVNALTLNLDLELLQDDFTITIPNFN